MHRDPAFSPAARDAAEAQLNERLVESAVRRRPVTGLRENETETRLPVTDRFGRPVMVDRTPEELAKAEEEAGVIGGMGAALFGNSHQKQLEVVLPAKFMGKKDIENGTYRKRNMGCFYTFAILFCVLTFGTFLAYFASGTHARLQARVLAGEEKTPFGQAARTWGPVALLFDLVLLRIVWFPLLAAAFGFVIALGVNLGVYEWMAQDARGFMHFATYRAPLIAFLFANLYALPMWITLFGNDLGSLDQQSLHKQLVESYGARRVFLGVGCVGMSTFLLVCTLLVWFVRWIVGPEHQERAISLMTFVCRTLRERRSMLWLEIGSSLLSLPILCMMLTAGYMFSLTFINASYGFAKNARETLGRDLSEGEQAVSRITVFLFSFLGPFVLAWTLNLKQAILRIAYSRCFAAHYFQLAVQQQEDDGLVPEEGSEFRHKKFLSGWTSFQETLSMNLGQATFGSFILTLVEWIRAAINAALRAAEDKNQRNPFILIAIAVLRYFIVQLEELLRFLTNGAYVWTAIYGTSFTESARSFKAVCENQGWAPYLQHCLQHNLFVLLHASVMITLPVVILEFLCLCGAEEVLTRHIFDRDLNTETPGEKFPAYGVLFVSCLAGVACGMHKGHMVISQGIYTLLVCFAEHPDTLIEHDEKLALGVLKNKRDAYRAKLLQKKEFDEEEIVWANKDEVQIA